MKSINNIYKAIKCLEEVLKLIPDGDIEKNSIFNKKRTCSKTSSPEMVMIIENAVVKYIKNIYDIDEEMVGIVCDTLKIYGEETICAIDINVVKGTWDPAILNIYLTLLSKEIFKSMEEFIEDTNINFNNTIENKGVMTYIIKNDVFPKFNIESKRINLFVSGKEIDPARNYLASDEMMKCMFVSNYMDNKKYTNVEDIVIYNCFIPALKKYIVESLVGYNYTL